MDKVFEPFSYDQGGGQGHLGLGWLRQGVTVSLKQIRRARQNLERSRRRNDGEVVFSARGGERGIPRLWPSPVR